MSGQGDSSRQRLVVAREKADQANGGNARLFGAFPGRASAFLGRSTFDRAASNRPVGQSETPLQRIDREFRESLPGILRQADHQAAIARGDMYSPLGRYTTHAHRREKPGLQSRALFHPEFARRLTGAIQDLNARGIVPNIESGYRTPEDQEYMRAGGSGPNPAAKVSHHQIGMAVDISGGASPTIRRAMVKQGLTWGGRFGDPPHYQLPPVGVRPTPEELRRYRRQ